MAKSYKYRGECIRPCESAERGPATAHRGNWIVQSYHSSTGMPYADQLCPHYISLAQAREVIRETQARDREASP